MSIKDKFMIYNTNTDSTNVVDNIIYEMILANLLLRKYLKNLLYLMHFNLLLRKCEKFLKNF